MNILSNKILSNILRVVPDNFIIINNHVFSYIRISNRVYTKSHNNEEILSITFDDELTCAFVFSLFTRLVEKFKIKINNTLFDEGNSVIIKVHRWDEVRLILTLHKINRVRGL